MRVGVIADAHDRLPAIAEFARRFRAAGAEMILHAGDHCAPWSLRPFQAENFPMVGVFGKCDGDREGLRAEAALGVGTELFESPHSVELNGTRILLVHDLADAGERSVAGHAIVIHGCTHEHSVENCGDTLLLNPGEACGWLHGTPTAAILDLDTRKVELITLDT
ncbi:MAG TPA: metallophosphoesterase [Gemmatimonadaceae bacterium]|jgi:phosphoesterase, MJ0936 family